MCSDEVQHSLICLLCKNNVRRVFATTKDDLAIVSCLKTIEGGIMALSTTMYPCLVQAKYVLVLAIMFSVMTPVALLVATFHLIVKSCSCGVCDDPFQRKASCFE
ncbi:hypothetical protein BCR41DRAFT_371696 [Lobosporangium transversale]|uniref:Uncharacterized protein n=1 Tax=Lobosporangium transversale TaxID=64571 RepID=A0A1Y2GJT4_9FUNG|nr:hypothetical protein BCR41DRAFT_371696 [Lobosporangium transversale]ORZ13001.1 hypothetical protein BCR41DRAFT_371696 [Lobosporangium transversale]|eukprot:XP_021880350.1 hypothetical protein BCR41DRAFT_371696 [Lobosporangium transversale]